MCSVFVDMTLSEFIQQIGDEAAASLFEVEERTAASWRRRERWPRKHKAKFIVEATKGVVDLAGVFADDQCSPRVADDTRAPARAA